MLNGTTRPTHAEDPIHRLTQNPASPPQPRSGGSSMGATRVLIWRSNSRTTRTRPQARSRKQVEELQADDFANTQRLCRLFRADNLGMFLNPGRRSFLALPWAGLSSLFEANHRRVEVERRIAGPCIGFSWSVQRLFSNVSLVFRLRYN